MLYLSIFSASALGVYEVIVDNGVYTRSIVMFEVTASGPASVSTPIPTPGPDQSDGNTGDVNSDGIVNNVDALMVAQYYVNLIPPGFSQDNGDVNCDGSVNIIDALIIAKYYVGLVTSFC